MNLSATKDENDRILEQLKLLPEAKLINRLADQLYFEENLLELTKKEQAEWIAIYNERIKKHERVIINANSCIKALLQEVETQSGFSKMPTEEHGTFALMNIAENYQVIDEKAVPTDYIITKITDSIDKKKLNQAIKDGLIDTNVNWLEKREAYRVVVKK